MNKLGLGAALVLCAYALPANAQATRTWVSGVGSDANSCSRSAPCATFSAALTKTNSGGEINCVDAGGFGAFTITKSITIDCGGAVGSILANGTNGIVVTAGVNDKIVLRNLNIQGVGAGSNGIRFTAGLHLTVDNVTITGFTSRGIDVDKSASANLYVRDTRIANIATGIRLFTGLGGINAQLDNVHIDNASASGLEVASGSTIASISNSVIMNAAGSGLLMSGGGFINASRTTIARSGIAVNSNASSGSIRVSAMNLQDNSTGFAVASGATISSAGNNKVIGTVGVSPNGGAIPFR
ncbi:MAG TPA: right-handed parallel beta-helix repeat-containing protein [Xanthobacteraceae bacterium]|nr:right-handed parallel beta-helix repeat-containing protein [Xanthobacteraceae bacterium]